MWRRFREQILGEIRNRSSRARGSSAEELGCRLLEEHGYRIEERNYSRKLGEIDVIAWDHDALCFIEIKSRSSERYGGPLASVDHRKQQRIRKVASLYLMGLANPPPCRFDVLALVIAPGGRPVAAELIKDAFW